MNDRSGVRERARKRRQAAQSFSEGLNEISDEIEMSRNDGNNEDGQQPEADLRTPSPPSVPGDEEEKKQTENDDESLSETEMADRLKQLVNMTPLLVQFLTQQQDALQNAANQGVTATTAAPPAPAMAFGTGATATAAAPTTMNALPFGRQGTPAVTAQQTIAPQAPTGAPPQYNALPLPPPPGGVIDELLMFDGNIIDTTTKDGRRHFLDGAKQFGNFSFDGKQVNLWSFVSHIKARAELMNCSQIFAVPFRGNYLNLLERYGELPLADVQAAAMTRWRIASWSRQASYIIALAILASLTDGFQRKVEQEAHDYRHAAHLRPDGPTLFKVICNLVMPSNRQTTTLLVDRLKNMRPSDYGNSIVDYNTHFTEQKIAVAAARDGSSKIPDEEVYNWLMVAYESVEHNAFQSALNVWDNQIVKLTPKQLMRQAEDKYNTFVEEGKWNVASKNIEIMGLKAKLTKDQRTNEKRFNTHDKAIKSLVAKMAGSRKRKDLKEPRKQKAKGAMSKAKFKRWLATEPPLADQAKVVKMKDPRGKETDWTWCKWHNRMVHAIGRDGKPHNSECCDLQHKSKDERDKTSNKREDRKQKRVKVKALQAQLEMAQAELESEDDSSDGYSTASDFDDIADD